MTKLLAVIALAALGVAGPALAAKPKVHTKSLSADRNGGLTFSKQKITVAHGTVKLVMRNPKGSGLPHGIAIAKHGKGKIVNPGKSSSVTAKLAKGTYTYYCPFPGHRAAGMTGKLTVN
jgi:plastocyanin